MANREKLELRRFPKRRPQQSVAQRAVVGVLSTADLVRRSLTRVVEKHGLTLQQFNVLRILRGAGANGLPTLQIGERMVETTPGLTGLLDRLLVKNLVERRRCAVDRRRVYCTITGKGLDVLEDLDLPVDLWERSVVEDLSLEDRQHLVRVLTLVQATLSSREA